MSYVEEEAEEEAVRKIDELDRNHNNVLRLVRNLKIESTDVIGGRCMRRNDGTPCLNEKDRAKLLEAHASKFVNEENEWDQIANANSVD